MRQKKSKLAYYFVGIILLAAIIFAITHEVPMEIENVKAEITAAEY